MARMVRKIVRYPEPVLRAKCRPVTEITPEIRNECAKIGGCILTLPDGRLLPIAVVKEAMQEAYEEGKAQGKAEAENACVKKRV